MMPSSTPPQKRRYHQRKYRAEKPTLDARVAVWAPAIMGAGVGFIWYASVGINPIVIPLLAAGAVVLVRGLTTGAGWLMGEAAFGTSGNTTPYKADYSRAGALAQRGDFDAAIEAYEAAIAESPADPEPYLRVARILHKELARLDDAAFWYRRVRRDTNLSTGRDLAVSRELIELYLASDARERTIPELARLIDKFPDTPERGWAEGILRDLRASKE